MSKKPAKKKRSGGGGAAIATPEELQAMEKCRATIAALPCSARRRAIEWLCAAFGIQVSHGWLC